MSSENQNEIRYAQDFLLKSCTITTAYGQPIDFSPVALEINLYEDIYSAFCSGDMLVTDANGLLNILSMSGNYMMEIVLAKPGLPDVYKKYFRVYKVTDRKLISDQNESYVLHFCSEELILSEQYKISKSYAGKKISDIVDNILQQYLKASKDKYDPSNKTNFIEETKGIYNFIIPSMKPFEALTWLSTYALSDSSQSPGSAYLFFEDSQGYRFKSLQTLIKEDPVQTYVYAPINVNMPDDPRLKDISRALRTVLSYEHVNNYDTLGAVMNGAFANRLITVDPILRTFQDNDFDYGAYSSTAKLMNGFPLMNNAQNRLGDKINDTPNAVQKITTTNTGQIKNSYIKTRQPSVKPINIETYIPYRTAQIALINMNKMRIVIPGDPTLRVGNTINFIFFEQASYDTGRKEDRFYSGKFLVTAIRHKIDQENKYLSILEISKESMPEAYTAFNNDMMAWKNIRGK